MPIMDGIETVKEIRKMISNGEVKKMKLIAVTANDLY